MLKIAYKCFLRRQVVSTAKKNHGAEKREKVEKVRKNDFFFAGMQKITTFACLFGEMP